MRTLLLTGAVIPSAPVKRLDPSIRLCDYRTAIFLWLSHGHFDRLIYVDASGFEDVCVKHLHYLASATGRKLESAAFDLRNEAKTYGKGRAETLLIDKAIEHFQLTEFCKITGRLFVRNDAPLIGQSNPIIFSPLEFLGPMNVDTRFYRMTAEFFRSRLLPLIDQMDDRRRDGWIEHLYAKAVTNIAVPWCEKPLFYGINASENIDAQS